MGSPAISGSDKYVFVFDADETLFSVDRQKKTDGIAYLSSSAQSDLSTSIEGILESPVMLKTASEKYRVPRVTALARHKFREIFESIKAANERAGEKIIFVTILTNASYTKEEVLAVLHRFFCVSEVDDFANRNDSGGRKEDYMQDLYKRRFERLGIPKKHIILVDDSFSNCVMVNTQGFESIHIPATPQRRECLEICKEERANSLTQLKNIAQGSKTLAFQRSLSRAADNQFSPSYLPN